jgi:hypothetical protein
MGMKPAGMGLNLGALVLLLGRDAATTPVLPTTSDPKPFAGPTVAASFDADAASQGLATRFLTIRYSVPVHPWTFTAFSSPTLQTFPFQVNVISFEWFQNSDGVRE